MSGLFGDSRCYPLKLREPYGCFLLADVDALKTDNKQLRKRIAELAHENALLCEQLDRVRRGVA